MDKQKAEIVSVSMYPVDKATLLQIGKDYGLTGVSATVRFILYEWMRLKGQQLADPVDYKADDGA